MTEESELAELADEYRKVRETLQTEIDEIIKVVEPSIELFDGEGKERMRGYVKELIELRDETPDAPTLTQMLIENAKARNAEKET